MLEPRSVLRGHPSDNIDITFWWNGTQTYELIFSSIAIRGLNSETRLNLPANFSGKMKFSICGDNKYSINIPRNQLSRISLVADVLVPVSLSREDARTGRIYTQIEREQQLKYLTLRFPETIESGALYTIVCTHEGAKLVKHNETLAALLEKIRAAWPTCQTHEEVKNAIEPFLTQLKKQPIEVLKEIAQQAENYRPAVEDLAIANFARKAAASLLK